MRYRLTDIGPLGIVNGVEGVWLRDAVRARWRLPAWISADLAELVREAERVRWESRLTLPDRSNRPLWLRTPAGRYLVNDSCALECYTLTTAEVVTLTGWSARWVFQYARLGHLPALVTPRAHRWCPIVVHQAQHSAAFWWAGIGPFLHQRTIADGSTVQIQTLYDAHKRGATGRPIRGGIEWG